MPDRLDQLVQELHQTNVTLEALRVSLEGLVRTSDDQEKRIRVVERWQQKLTPVFAVGTFVLGALFTELLKRFV